MSCTASAPWFPCLTTAPCVDRECWFELWIQYSRTRLTDKQALVCTFLRRIAAKLYHASSAVHVVFTTLVSLAIIVCSVHNIQYFYLGVPTQTRLLLFLQWFLRAKTIRRYRKASCKGTEAIKLSHLCSLWICGLGTNKATPAVAAVRSLAVAFGTCSWRLN